MCAVVIRLISGDSMLQRDNNRRRMYRNNNSHSRLAAEDSSDGFVDLQFQNTTAGTKYNCREKFYFKLELLDGILLLKSVLRKQKQMINF